MEFKIYKFGGASIKDANSIRNVAEIVKQNQSAGLVLVISALGKTTNALEEVADAYYFKKGNAAELTQKIKANHFAVATELFPAGYPVFDELNNCFVEIDWILEDEPLNTFDYIYDQIISIGEMASSRLIAAYLNLQNISTQWIDARDLIRTDNTYREGQVNWELTEPMIQNRIRHGSNTIRLTQGFLGGTSENYTTTLGREGSDYTAAILAYCLNAKSVTIWKDVPGVLNADPRYFKSVEKLNELSWLEAIEMSFYGATVIHPKTIKPLQNKNIPLYVRSFLEKENEGTVIHEISGSLAYPPMLVLKPKQTLLSVSPKDFSFMAEENISYIFSLFARHHIKVNMMQSTAISFSVCIDSDTEHVQHTIDELSSGFKVLRNDQLQLLTIRHYTDPVIQQYTAGKKILLEQKTRSTLQVVIA